MDLGMAIQPHKAFLLMAEGEEGFYPLPEVEYSLQSNTVLTTGRKIDN